MDFNIITTITLTPTYTVLYTQPCSPFVIITVALHKLHKNEYIWWLKPCKLYIDLNNVSAVKDNTNSYRKTFSCIAEGYVEDKIN